jgi:hypothetical protein
MLPQLSYRFTKYRTEMDRLATVQGYANMNPEDARLAMRDGNDRNIDRLKTDFELHEESTIADLRMAVQRLTDTGQDG